MLGKSLPELSETDIGKY